MVVFYWEGGALPERIRMRNFLNRILDKHLTPEKLNAAFARWGLIAHDA